MIIPGWRKSGFSPLPSAGMNGIELIRSLRTNAAYKFTPMVLLTTESQAEKKQEGKKAGATGWIVKPFQPEKLLAVVKKLVG